MLAALQGVLQPLDRAVGVGIDGVVHLHLKNQVRAALEVKAEWMRFCSAAFRPAAVKLLGMPKMPNRKTISTAMIRIVLARRFFVHEKQQPY